MDMRCECGHYSLDHGWFPANCEIKTCECTHFSIPENSKEN